MKSLKWINTIAFLAMIGVNIAANMIPIGGHTTGEVSEAYPNMFTPAPITFAIWGLIYLMMLLFILFQWGFIGSKLSSTKIRDDIGLFFPISCLLNICWILAWHMEKIELSVLLIVLLLVSLIFITMRVDKTRSSFVTYIMSDAGFDLYFGWIIAATIANISVLLVKLDWNRWGISESIWTIIILLVGALIGSIVVIKDNRYMSGLAIIWAYIGIIIKHTSLTGYRSKYPLVIGAACLGILMIIFSCIYRLIEPNSKYGITSSMD